MKWKLIFVLLMSATSSWLFAFDLGNSENYGPISSGDTLWSIADGARPDSSTSIQQMMLALLRANPEAFIENNINGLKRGQILRIPDRDDVASQSVEEALATTRSQNVLWEEFSGFIASTSSIRPDSVIDTTSDMTVQPATEPELRLVSSSAPGGGGGQTTGTDTDISQLRDDLALADEQLEILAFENVELRNRINESEAIIQDLRRLIELKDNELAALQQRLVGAGIATEDTEDVEVVEGAEEEVDVVEIVEEQTPSKEIAEGDMADMVTEQTDGEVEDMAAPPPIVTTVQTPTQSRLMEQILGWVTGHLMTVGGAIITMVLIGAAAVFVRNRKVATGDEDDATVLLSETESASLTPETGEAVAEESQPEAEEPNEDPLTEVNVFLASEHFDQAEEFVRDAISGDPDNLNFHSKLLEIFYSATDKTKYEEEAKVLHDLVNGEGPHWEMATIMWQEMSPNRALFGEVAEREQEAGAEGEKADGIVDLTAGDDSSKDASLDFDLGITDELVEKIASVDENVLGITSGSEGKEDLLDATAADSAEISTEDGLPEPEKPDSDDNAPDFDIGGIGITEADKIDDTVSSNDNVVDFDFSSAFGESDGSIDLDMDIESPGESQEASLDLDSREEDGGIELDLGSDETASEPKDDLELGSDMNGDKDGGEIQLNIGTDDSISDDGLEISLDSDASATIDSAEIPKSSKLSLDEEEGDEEDQIVFTPRASDASRQSQEDEIATKLDLAKTYAEMGDKDSAKSILDEIISDGNDNQRKQAEDLLSQIS